VVYTSSTLLSVSFELVLNLALAPWWVQIGHLLKLKCSHSPLNRRILSSTSVPLLYTYDGANVKFISNSHETDYSVVGNGSFIYTNTLSLQQSPFEFLTPDLKAYLEWSCYYISYYPSTYPIYHIPRQCMDGSTHIY
jgi:hypothetical protein